MKANQGGAAAMKRIDAERVLRRVPKLEAGAHAVSRGIHNEVLKGGPPAWAAADVLHGKWLGHPLHAALTDFTVGAWILAPIFDCLGEVCGLKGAERAADRLVDMGNAAAVPTALAGIADFSTLPDRAMATGAVHGLLNACGLALNLLSASARRSGRRPLGVLLSAMASGGLLLSTWLGGELVYRHKVGVNRTQEPSGPQDWTAVLQEQQLQEDAPRRIEVNGSPVLLYRHKGTIYAIGAVCAHDAGALEQGTVEDHCVTCPLHQSVYDLENGSVVHGPANYAEPDYDVRVTDGKIELKLKDT
jgi:nitrite reductase/ring-hydroxylating ferredoxin subunit/uncharacterized membrane protein